MTERFERKKVFNNGVPSVRYVLEERLDDHERILVAVPIVEMRVPTQDEIDRVAQARLREALVADPTLGGKISEPVWEGDIDTNTTEESISKE